MWQIIILMYNAEQKSISDRNTNHLYYYLFFQVTEITHILRMGQLNLIDLKEQDAMFPTLRISSVAGTIAGRRRSIQQIAVRKPSDTGSFVWSSILPSTAMLCFYRS